MKLLKANQYLQTSALRHPQTYLSMKLLQIVSPFFDATIFVKNDVFNTFYEDYVEFKHYVNDIMKSVTPNSELLTSLSDENNLEKMKIKWLEKEIKNLKNQNTPLRENILTQLKVTENLSGNNDRITTNTPIIDKTKQKMTLT